MSHGNPVILRETSGGARLSARNEDGTFDVVIITEGVGSTGEYSAALMSETSASVFENVGSHPNHPADPKRPDQRSPMGLIGRIVDVKPGADDGKAALVGKFKPGNEDIAKYVEENLDLLALSIYCEAFGEKSPLTGKTVVESFNGAFPYRSVDIVLAGGRGGRIKLAQESLLAIESALGTSEGAQPGSTSAPGTPIKEKDMDEATAQALLTSVQALAAKVDAIAEAPKAPVVEEKTPATPEEIMTAVKAAVKQVAAVKEAKLTPKLEAPLIEAAEAGIDVTGGIADAQAILTEARGGQSPASGKSATLVAEGASGKPAKHNYFLPRLGGN